MDLDDLSEPEPAPTIEGYLPIDTIPPGHTAEQLFRDRMNQTSHPSDSVMLIVDEGDGSGEPVSWLNAGVSRDFGMLQWRDRSGFWVPSARHNPDRTGWIRFYHPTGVEVPLSATMAAPLSLVYEAVDEVMTSKARPTCVEWTPFQR